MPKISQKNALGERASSPKRSGATEEREAVKNALAGQQERKTLPMASPVNEFEGELVVWSMPVRNSRLVIAHVPGSDPWNPMNLVSVMVRSNENFLPGMKIPGPGRRLDRTGSTTFTLNGPCPRWRGRW